MVRCCCIWTYENYSGISLWILWWFYDLIIHVLVVDNFYPSPKPSGLSEGFSMIGRRFAYLYYTKPRISFSIYPLFNFTFNIPFQYIVFNYFMFNIFSYPLFVMRIARRCFCFPSNKDRRFYGEITPTSMATPSHSTDGFLRPNCWWINKGQTKTPELRS